MKSGKLGLEMNQRTEVLTSSQHHHDCEDFWIQGTLEVVEKIELLSGIIMGNDVLCL